MSSKKTDPRSVHDATRFTSTTPQATSKQPRPSTTSSRSPPAVAGASAIGSSAGAPAAVPRTGGRNSTASSASSSRLPGETPEQRVKRLRAAHLAAQKAQLSKADRVVDAGRRFADVAHRWTVTGLVAFTAIAGVVSVYSVWDMLRYNRARRAEWLEAQKKLEDESDAGSLGIARLAYINGTATEAQILQVEEANRDAKARGLRLPPLIAPPERRTHFEETFGGPSSSSKTTAVPGGTSDSKELKWEEGSGKGVVGVWSAVGRAFGLGQESAASSSTTTTTQNEDGTTAKVTAAVDQATQNVEQAASRISEKTKGVWEAERQRQRTGGSLDRLGVATSAGVTGHDGGSSTSSKGWWPW